MKVKIFKFLYEYFDNCKFIENDLEWIIGYSSSNNVKKLCNEHIGFDKKELVEIDISESVYIIIYKEIDSDELINIEKAINIFYLTLFVLGGTS